MKLARVRELGRRERYGRDRKPYQGQTPQRLCVISPPAPAPAGRADLRARVPAPVSSTVRRSRGRPDELGTFFTDTRVERRDDDRFEATVTDRWSVMGHAPNGGYLMAVAARAMAAVAAHPHPVTVTAHFLRPPVPGDVTVDTEVLKTGRRHTHVGARLLQDGQECVRLLAGFADLDSADGPTEVHRQPLELPAVSACFDPNAADTDGFAPPILRRFDHRMPPGAMDWIDGRPSGRGEISGYCRFADDEPMDVFGLLVVADAYPPAIFNAGGAVGWVPTVEMTVQIRKRPAPGWLSTRFTTSHVTRGYLEEDGEVWDAEGDVVALSRQLALFAQPPPDGG
jgi:acyl-coenzyme A thioesterase PaaI-like protein